MSYASSTSGEGIQMNYGEGMSQEDFMLKDECLILNYNDEVIGADNKYNVHKFVEGQPKGIVHRAFSVMLFDSEGRLLLQQRAAEKVTFPTVWTNTCCSHPLYGQAPSEVDTPGTDPIGVKRAAVRKLRHELGVKPGAVSPEGFKYMGRVHYWASDTLTHGPSSPWGEHEIDYLLLYQMAPGSELELAPNPEEVMAVDWVAADELQKRMADPSLLWSPWYASLPPSPLPPSPLPPSPLLPSASPPTSAFPLSTSLSLPLTLSSLTLSRRAPVPAGSV